MIITFFDIQNSEKDVFKKAITGHKLIFHNQSLNSKLASLRKDTQILYIRSLSVATASILNKFPHLKLITTRSTGYDNIDLGYCRQKGITVCNVPAYASNRVAEYTFMLMLALSHRMMQSIKQMQNCRFNYNELRGFELKGKTLGVAGLGNIGSRVVEIAKGLSMNILVATKHPSPARAKKHRVKFVDFSTLLEKCDIVTLHVPLNGETTHMINKKNIVFMKKGSLLINTSRGKVVETDAVVWALEKGILEGAGLDVLEDETIYTNNKRMGNPKIQSINRKLMQGKNVIITPHNAYNSQEAIKTILEVSAQNINAFLRGKPINTIA